MNPQLIFKIGHDLFDVSLLFSNHVDLPSVDENIVGISSIKLMTVR